MKYFALVDCNNFYASCERVFQPRYAHDPIIVLSNNDGCVVARSEEAKALGIPMGAPLFQVRELVRTAGVRVFSSNYTLYGDLSRRVMEILGAHCAEIEVYSIDEAFLRLDFRGQSPESLLHFARRLRWDVLRSTGIPVSIGIAPSKTLAKLANHIAKRRTDEGVYFLLPQDPILSELPVAEVWGVGRAYERRLAERRITTVAQLQESYPGWIRQEFGVVGLRLLRELQGYPCLALEPPVTSRKHTMVSRSFARDVSDREDLRERLAVYATRLGEKLRRYGQATTVLTIYLWTNRFRNARADGRTCFARTLELPRATNHTATLIAWASAALEVLHEPGTNYKKAGILAADLVPADQIQENLFIDPAYAERAQILSELCDRLNRRLGYAALFFATCGRRPEWRMRQEHRSGRYTTRWGELLGI